MTKKVGLREAFKWRKYAQTANSTTATKTSPHTVAADYCLNRAAKTGA